eukprot:scaffold1366_cov155-Skeletonema_menzelii.AAC.19
MSIINDHDHFRRFIHHIIYHRSEEEHNLPQMPASLGLRASHRKQQCFRSFTPLHFYHGSENEHLPLPPLLSHLI